MESMQQYVFGFVEGRVPAKDFIRRMEEDSAVLDWVQSVVPSDWVFQKIIRDKNETYPFQNYTVAIVPYNIRDVLAQINYGRRNTAIGCQLNIHSTIADIMLKSFPEEHLHPDESLRLLDDLLLDTCPDYIDGSEVEESGILEEILAAIPKNLSRTAGKRWAKEEIKRRFHIEGHHRPHWIQAPEWPMLNGEPMEYVRTVKHGVEGQTHYFRDPQTGVERTVEDWH